MFYGDINNTVQEIGQSESCLIEAGTYTGDVSIGSSTPVNRLITFNIHPLYLIISGSTTTYSLTSTLYSIFGIAQYQNGDMRGGLISVSNTIRATSVFSTIYWYSDRIIISDDKANTFNINGLTYNYIVIGTSLS